MATSVQKINPFIPADKEEKQLLGWEKSLEDRRLAMETAAFRLFNVGAAVSSFELILENEDEPAETGAIGDGAGAGWDDSTEASLSISSDLAGKITNYAALKVEDEIVIVKSVDRTANTVDLFQRGYGSTDAAAHADETTAEIIGYNYTTGVKDIESMITGSSSTSYYVAKNTVPAVTYTKEDLTMARKDYGEANMPDYVNSQIDMQDKNLLQKMNKSLLFSSGQKPENGKPGMVVGLLEEAEVRGNVVTTFGAIDSVSKINDALTASRNKGGFSNVILCGPDSYDDIQALANDSGITQSVPDRLNMVLGSSVAAIQTKVGALIPVLDLSMPSDKVVILNSDNLYWAPFAGFEVPGADRTVAQESVRNDQQFTVDSISEGATYYLNSNKDMTLLTGVTH